MQRYLCAAAAALLILAAGSCAAEAPQRTGEGPRQSANNGTEAGRTAVEEGNGAVPLAESVELTAGLPVTVQEAPVYGDPPLPAEYQGQTPPRGAGRAFTTDFSRATVSYEEIIAGGPPKDGIPSIDEPQFIPIGEAAQWLAPQEAVLVAGVSDDSPASETTESRVRIYPLQILMWHEIVNDTVGGVPIAVTYCPLCNTGIVFLRRYDGRVLEFGTTGRVRFSNLIMYDRQTESWWQQASGTAIAGRYAGGTLRILPVLNLSWREARSRYPEAQVLSRDTGYSKPYGRNPYSGYDQSERPFLYRGPEAADDHSPMERVYAVKAGGEWQAYPYTQLRRRRVIQETVGGQPVAVFWQSGQASPLESSELAAGRDVGSANSFVPRADGRELEFRLREGRIIDLQTGSRWDASGTAVSGPLAGMRLEPVPGTRHFWFSWNAFREE